MLFNAATALFLAAAARAIMITAPTNSSGWTAGEPMTITWDSVSTDPKTFDIAIEIPNPAKTETKTIAEKVDTSAGSYSYTPDSTLEGEGFRVNFINPDNNAILAQTNQFDIKAGSSSTSATATDATNTASSSKTDTASGSSSSTGATTSGSAASSATSGTHTTGHTTGSTTGSTTGGVVPNASHSSGASALFVPSLALVAGSVVALLI